MTTTVVRLHFIVFIVAAALVSTGCSVWTDYGEPLGSDGGTTICGEDCVAPWWDASYAQRFRLSVVDDYAASDEPITLPVLLDGDAVEVAALREDGEDLRVVLDGEELPREVASIDATGGAVVWARFPRAPRAGDELYLYWDHPDAPIARSPWSLDEAPGVFHFESTRETSVPGGEELLVLRGDFDFAEGRVGEGIAVEAGAVMRFLGQPSTNPVDGRIVTIEFSVKGRYTENRDRGVVQSPRECRFLRVVRLATRETAVGWTPDVDCTADDRPETVATVPVDLFDGTWHDVVAVIDSGAGEMRLYVDDQEATVPIEPADVGEGKIEWRSGDSDSGEVFVYDEVRITTIDKRREEVDLLFAAMRGEVFSPAGVEVLEQ